MKGHIAKFLIIIALFLLTTTFLCLLYIFKKDYSNYFCDQHGSIVSCLERPDSIQGKYWVTLINTNNFNVECGLLAPLDSTRRYPAILLLGGKATGKYAIDYAMDIENIIVLAVDYPYEPRENYSFWNIISDIPKVRKALIDMVPASMLAIDYLFKRKDVDTTKVVMLGYSFGAPFVPIVTSLDRRIKVAVMVYGGGELTSLIRHNVARYKGKLLSEFLGILGGILLNPLEPMRYADKISPTPLIMINGLSDEQIPRYNTELFFNAAKEPKNLIWLESKHVHPKNVNLTRLIIATIKRELQRLEIL